MPLNDIQEGYKSDSQKYKLQIWRYSMLTCGDGGSTGQEIVNQINQNTSDIGANIVDIATHSAQIQSHDTKISQLETTTADHESRISANEADILVLQGPDPRASLRLDTDTDVGLTDTYAKLSIFNQARVSRGGFTADETNDRLINDSGKDIPDVLVSLGLNVLFPGNETMDILVYVNGNPYSNSEFTLRGYGDNKPQAIYWESDMPFNDGDILEIYAKSNSGDFTATFHRTHFAVSGIVQDLI